MGTPSFNAPSLFTGSVMSYSLMREEQQDRIQASSKPLCSAHGARIRGRCTNPTWRQQALQ